MHEPVFFQCPSLDQETIIHLQGVIQTGREETKIDLKREHAFTNERGKAELAKDVSAIANTPEMKKTSWDLYGGYVVRHKELNCMGVTVVVIVFLCIYFLNYFFE